MPQTGADHYLYLAYDSNDPSVLKTINQLVDEAGDGMGTEPATPVTCNTIRAEIGTIKLNAYNTIRDVTVGGNPTTVDSTTREDAREGFQTQLLVYSESTMSVQIRYEPADAAGLIVDPGYQALMTSFLTRTSLFGIDLDKPIDQLGAAGLGGNWRIGFSQPKPVGGLVVVDFSFTLDSKAQYLKTIAGDIFGKFA